VPLRVAVLGVSIDRSIDTPRTATRNGTTYTINTGNIGKRWR